MKPHNAVVQKTGFLVESAKSKIWFFYFSFASAFSILSKALLRDSVEVA
jgi:hypothetical protein